MTSQLKRRPHRKSRTGCSECKRRRIKCDEGKPRCAHCVRYEKSCIYLNIPTPATQRPSCERPLSASEGCPSPTSTVRQQSTSQTDIPEIAPYFLLDASSFSSAGASFDLKDMALLYHWTLVTSRSILNTPELDHFWQRVFPEIAFQHSYLMHRILSIAALHVVYLCPENKRLRLREAAHHHAQALVGFRESINTLGQHNSDALFASAVLTWFYAFLSFGKLYDEDCEDANPAARTSRILGAEWIPLIRGVGAILTPVYEHVRVGRLNPMLTLTNWDETDPDTQPGPGDEKLLRLRDSWPSDGDADVYNETLFLLRKSNAWMGQFLGQRGGSVSQQESGYNRDWSGPFIWLFLVPEKYFTLQCQRQPLALVLFAHFGALLQCLDGYWWMQGCGRSVVGVVDECLGPYWSQWMDWPKMVVGLS